MSIIRDVASVINSVRGLIGMLWPSRPEKPLVRQHFFVDSDGSRQCVYCQTPYTEQSAKARCSYFK